MYLSIIDIGGVGGKRGTVFTNLCQALRWRDYIRMGVGIERRYQRCCTWWRPHIALCRDFVAQHSRPSRKVAVFGAGRLLDIDLKSLLSVSEEVHLFDCDPTAIRAWRQAVSPKDMSRVFFRIEDVTGCLQKWTKILGKRSFKKGAATELFALQANQPTWLDENFDGLISLNLLGQIPLYWRDRVLSKTPNRCSATLAALEKSMASLQVAHLEALRASNSKWASIISDTEYYSYTCEKSEWEVEPALFGDARIVWEAFGQSGRSERWLWHLAPQFVESDQYGEIHRVEAKSTIYTVLPAVGERSCMINTA